MRFESAKNERVDRRACPFAGADPRHGRILDRFKRPMPPFNLFGLRLARIARRRYQTQVPLNGENREEKRQNSAGLGHGVAPEGYSTITGTAGECTGCNLFFGRYTLWGRPEEVSRRVLLCWCRFLVVGRQGAAPKEGPSFR